MASLAKSADGISPAAGGMFSPLARTQYGALAKMRWEIFRNTFRSASGALELGARGVSILVYSLMGLGLAFGMGAGAFAAAAHGQWMILPVLFWSLFVLWQVVPVTLASFQQQFDLAGLLRFPVSFGAFYLLHMIFGLIDISTIMGGFCCAGIWIGFTAARPGLAGWAAVSLLTFAAFNILLVRAVFAWIDRWLARRRTREIFTAVFFISLLAMNFFNPAFRGQFGKTGVSAETRATLTRSVRIGNSIQRWLPPGLAARLIHGGADSNLPDGAESFVLLGLFLLATGATLGVRLGAEYRGESLSEAPGRSQEEKHTGRWLLDGSGPIAAVLEKEVRTILRALPLLYGLGAPLVMVFLFSGLFKRSATMPGHLPWGLLLCLAYAVVGFTQLLYNNLGTEGAGIQILLLSPTPIRTVIFAKNIFHSFLLAVITLLVCLIAGLRYGATDPLSLAVSLSWVAFALPVHLAAGNCLSIVMPYRINMGRISRQKGSQASALLSLGVQVVVLAAGAGVLAGCAYFQRLWLAAPVLLGLAVLAAFAWLGVLRRVDALANSRRETLMEKLVRAE